LNLNQTSHHKVWVIAKNRTVFSPFQTGGNHPLFHLSQIDFDRIIEKRFIRNSDPGYHLWDFFLNGSYFTDSELINENTYIHYSPGDQPIEIKTDKDKGLLLISVTISPELLSNSDIPTKRRGAITGAMMKILLEIGTENKNAQISDPMRLSALRLLLILAAPLENVNKPCALSYSNARKVHDAIERFQMPKEKERNYKGLLEYSNLHPYQFKMGCRELYGRSASQVEFQLNMERSIRLLLSETLSLEQISQIAGYGSRSNFITAFKRNFGITPYQLRNSFRSNTGG